MEDVHRGELLLQGDLHPENTLSTEREPWAAIDPIAMSIRVPDRILPRLDDARTGDERNHCFVNPGGRENLWHRQLARSWEPYA